MGKSCFSFDNYVLTSPNSSNASAPEVIFTPEAPFTFQATGKTLFVQMIISPISTGGQGFVAEFLSTGTSEFVT
jgi:hypothetical protein